jgi:glycosyltransferase involved in cell wall biosynthesis
MKTELRIAFLSEKSPFNLEHWSGTIHSFHVALSRYVGSVNVLTPRLPRYLRALQLANQYFRILFCERLGVGQSSILLSLAYGAFYRRAIRKSGCNVIFAPIAAAEIGYLQTDVPIVYVSDTTFRAQENYYYKSSEISRLTRWEGHHLQKRAIRNADALVFSNQWAFDSAVNIYGADPSKLHVIPFGANINEAPPLESLHSGSKDGKCRLLFVSKDWNRKGGDIAYEAFLALRKTGVNAELTVVGCVPGPIYAHEDLHVVPYLDKINPAERAILNQYYLDADFFLLPTRAECSAIVFCEAAAFGLPVVTTETGGVPTVVHDGESGILLPLEARGDAYADVIFQLWNEPDAYRVMRRKSRQRYEETLNWKSWAESIRPIMEHLVEQHAKDADSRLNA